MQGKYWVCYVPSCRGIRFQNIDPDLHEYREACRDDACAAAARFNGATDMRRAAMFTMFISSARAAAVGGVGGWACSSSCHGDGGGCC